MAWGEENRLRVLFFNREDPVSHTELVKEISEGRITHLSCTVSDNYVIFYGIVAGITAQWVIIKVSLELSSLKFVEEVQTHTIQGNFRVPFPPLIGDNKIFLGLSGGLGHQIKVFDQNIKEDANTPIDYLSDTPPLYINGWIYCYYNNTQIQGVDTQGDPKTIQLDNGFKITDHNSWVGIGDLIYTVSIPDNDSDNIRIGKLDTKSGVFTDSHQVPVSGEPVIACSNGKVILFFFRKPTAPTADVNNYSVVKIYP